MGRIPTVGTWYFLGTNNFGTRRRAANAWLAEEILFLENILLVTFFKLIFPRDQALKEKLNPSQMI